MITGNKTQEYAQPLKICHTGAFHVRNINIIIIRRVPFFEGRKMRYYLFLLLIICQNTFAEEIK
ncbi:TPA_asm: hypothetical protein G2930_08240, partial [Salmonella enterica subsp. enterica serovar Mbandaka]|nr:hypothetical protein [Salmonella enterica subsp. enterica serovar Mbandaka]